MGKYKTYGKYKPSDLEWIGEVPEHWLFLSLKWVVEKRITDGPHETPELLDDGVIFISAEAVENGKINFNRARGFISREQHNIYAKKCLPKRDDIFIVKSGSTTGKVAYVDTDIEFNIWSPLALIRTKKEICNSRFLFYALTSDFFQKQVQLSWSFGTQPNIGMGVIENLKVSLPPIEEQKQIAHFLDLETTRIDTLITKKRQLIDLLQKKRDAIIYEAVTKGLEENVDIVESNIDWLEMIPVHWKSTRLKFITLEITVGIVVTPAKYYVDSGVPCLRSLNVKAGNLVDNDLVFISPESNELHRKSKIYENDLVVVRSGQPGTTAVVDQRFNGANCIDLIIVRQSQLFNSSYLAYLANSDFAKIQFSLGSGGAIQQHFNVGTAANLCILLPPLEEQQEIVGFLNERVEHLEKTIAKVQESVDLLQREGESLITAAVTGKIDVREEMN